MSGKIQSVLFSKTKYTKERANKWLVKHQLHKLKPFHETEHFYRARIREPDEFKRFITIKHKDKDIILGF